jgi:hypothetical protein
MAKRWEADVPRANIQTLPRNPDCRNQKPWTLLNLNFPSKVSEGTRRSKLSGSLSAARFSKLGAENTACRQEPEIALQFWADNPNPGVFRPDLAGPSNLSVL